LEDFALVKTLDGHKESVNTINVIPIELPINVEETPVQPNADESKPVSSMTIEVSEFRFVSFNFAF
jgi:hypothetical protein